MAYLKEDLSALVNGMVPGMAEKQAAIRAQYGENKRIDGDYDESLAVKCINGTFVGKSDDGFIVYKGIPFVGEQPVGDLRWKAPVDYVTDDGVYEAYYNAKSAWQANSLSESASLFYKGEDCLYLNIWTSEVGSAAKRPVMVWIHGGGFMMGGTVDPLHQCDSLILEHPDVVFVTITYRLGIFGFTRLSHLPDGADYPDAQNLGLMDQVQALKWIHENIAAFGGDPDNVTIFGESAGGGSVTCLPLVEGAQKYFKRVIAQSGSPLLTRSTEQSIELTNSFMEQLGCKTVADLKKVDPERLVEASVVFALREWPERDGKYLPLDTWDAYERGMTKDIDILHGCNKDEMGYFIEVLGGLESYDPWAAGRKEGKLAELTDAEKELVEDFCRNARDTSAEYSASSRLFDQIMFIGPVFRTSEAQAKAKGRSFAYFFTPEASVPLVRSGHAVELATVFNKPELGKEQGMAFDETFGQILRAMWVQFAKTGDPSLTAEISPDGKEHVWPIYDTKDRYVMCFDEENVHAERESERRICDWERLFLTDYYCI